VDEADLERFAYGGDAVRKREDLRSLREQGLVVPPDEPSPASE